MIVSSPERPSWEPVRRIDFDGERLEALKTLRTALLHKPLRELSVMELAMRAILEQLDRGTVTVGAAKAEAMCLGAQRHRLIHGRAFPQREREMLILTVGAAWTHFTAHNFPLNDNPYAELLGEP